MISVRGYATQSAKSPLAPFNFERRDPGPRDVLIDILYCGICHSDIHSARGEWGGATYPMVPGHEIVGRVARVGAKVKRFKPGDAAGVGCFVDSCRSCPECKRHQEQFCKQVVFTYNSVELDGKTPTYGGYSTQIDVNEDYVLRIAKGLPLERVAPLLCAGITTYSPLRHWKVGKGDKVGVVGLGGLGHMAVKLATAMGAQVTVFSTSKAKEADARRLGATQFVASNEPGALSKSAKLDFMIDTVSAPHPVSSYLELLRSDGTLVLVGASPEPLEVQTFALIMGRKTLSGSLIGGIKETQEMLDYCAKKKVFADVELIPASQINDAYERTLAGNVRYRFVIDLKTI
jgi:alcohol dehydrogenase (NADP+)